MLFTIGSDVILKKGRAAHFDVLFLGLVFLVLFLFCLFCLFCFLVLGLGVCCFLWGFFICLGFFLILSKLSCDSLQYLGFGLHFLLLSQLQFSEPATETWNVLRPA